MERITKLSINDIADALVAYRKQRGVKLTKVNAHDIVNDVFAVVSQLLTEENVGITLGKVGFIYNGVQKGRIGRHPQTLAQLHIPDKRAIKFKPAQAYKERLNN